jgi:hypothetical protein
MFVAKLGPSHNGRTFRHGRSKGKQNTSREIPLKFATYGGIRDYWQCQSRLQ